MVTELRHKRAGRCRYRNSLTQYTLILILVAITLCVAACTPADVLTSPAPSPQEGERPITPAETIEPTEVADAAPRQTGVVPGQTNLRAEATTDSVVRASLPPGTEYTVLGTTSNDPSIPKDQVWLQVMIVSSDGSTDIGYIRFDISGFEGNAEDLPLLMIGRAATPGVVVEDLQEILVDTQEKVDVESFSESEFPPNVEEYLPKNYVFRGYQHADPNLSLNIELSPGFDAKAYFQPFFLASLCDHSGVTHACGGPELAEVNAMLEKNGGTIPLNSPIMWFDEGTGTKRASDYTLISRLRFADTVEIVVMTEGAHGRGWGASDVASFMWNPTEEIDGMYTISKIYLVVSSGRADLFFGQHPQVGYFEALIGLEQMFHAMDMSSDFSDADLERVANTNLRRFQDSNAVEWRRAVQEYEQGLIPEVPFIITVGSN
jgi:hypothetical protein